MEFRLGNERSMVFSYLELRKAIGFLGIALPFVVSLGALIFFQTGVQSSISAYYYTEMRDVFVGILCIIGFFLLSYRGYERSDDIAGDLGCLFAVGAALFPTALDCTDTSGAHIIGFVHFAFSAAFFLTLIYFSLFLFTKTDPKNNSLPRKKQQRNKVYKACGYTMAVCILLIATYSILPSGMKSLFEEYKPVYWLEALAVIAFGISWITKGQAILQDEV